MEARNEIVVYQPDETVRLDVRLENETVWLTQGQMAVLFGCGTDNVGLHLKNIYAVGELSKEATTEEFSVVRTEGTRRVRRRVTGYNLDAIISVGYRVNSFAAGKHRRSKRGGTHGRRDGETGGGKPHGGPGSAGGEDFGMVSFLIAGGGGRLVGFGRPFKSAHSMTSSFFHQIPIVYYRCCTDGGDGFVAILKSSPVNQGAPDAGAIRMAKPFMEDSCIAFPKRGRVMSEKGNWQ